MKPNVIDPRTDGLTETGAPAPAAADPAAGAGAPDAQSLVVDEPALAEYLLQTPDFFLRHPEVLDRVRLPDPHGDRVLSLHERQLVQLRDQRSLLEQRLASLMAVGRENDALGACLQRLTRSLLLAREPADMPERVIDGLRREFTVPMAAMRLWNLAPAFASLPVAAPVDPETRTLADDLRAPYCGLTGRHPQSRWLADGGVDARSMAMLALRRGADPQAFGLIVLGSPDADRFQTGMGTHFLERIAEIASAALSRLLDVPGGDDVR